MRIGAVAGVALLCTLPALGDPTRDLPLSVVNALTPIDTVPSKSAINNAFSSPQAALEKLCALAINADRQLDLGIELRAIGTLPSYCPPAPQSCGPGTLVHDTLASLLISKQSSRLGEQQTPQDLLRLRAAVEALGQTRSGLSSDVELLLPLLSSESRDLRATVARALVNVCHPMAIEPLERFLELEHEPHVKAEMRAALEQLAQCPG